jgi:hypothetical protein
MKPINHILSIWFGAIMILVVLTGAITLGFTDLFTDRLYGNKRIGFIFILIAYAIYRSFRIYLLIRKPKD